MNAKKLLRIFAVPTVLAAVVALVMVVPAFAMEEPCWTDFDLSDCVAEATEEVGPPVIDVTQDVTNDLDSGVEAWWAYLNDYQRSIAGWQIEEDPLFAVIVQYDGTFTSVAGPSPNGTGEVGEGVTGTMQGGYVAFVYGEWLEDPAWPETGYVGLYDYGATWTDLDEDGVFDYGEESFSDERISWLLQYLEEGYEFEYIWWGWRYDPRCPSNGYWINSQDGNEGDILGPPDLSCLPPAPTPDPLVIMYVYHSETGYFGGEGPEATNTLTIWSAQGEPAPERVAYWAGVASPADLPADSHLACAAILWDDGAGGTFACDDFLGSVGERRALLRDDPEGRDILEPILRYLSWAAPE